jgi:hypothetical protein
VVVSAAPAGRSFGAQRKILASPAAGRPHPVVAVRAPIDQLEVVLDLHRRPGRAGELNDVQLAEHRVDHRPRQAELGESGASEQPAAAFEQLEG